MSPWTLLKQRQKKPQLVRNDSSLRLLQAARGQAELKVSSLGSIWVDSDGLYRGVLLFTIRFQQPGKPLLKSSQVNLSFDCHPHNDDCHEAGKSGCHSTQDQPRRHRGTVTYSLPTRLEGEWSELPRTQNDQYELSPNLDLPSVGGISVFALRRDISTERILKDRWVFKSSINPPLNYKGFHENTDVRYDWNENSLDITDYPWEVQIAVIVDCQSDCSFRLLMTLTIDLALRGKPLYWSKSDKSQYFFDVENKQDDLNRVLDTIGNTSFHTATVKIITFRVQCTSQDDVTIKLVGQGDMLGGWDPSKAIGLYKESDDGKMTQWHAKIIAEVGKELEYKFVRVLSKGSEISWEAGDNRSYTVQAIYRRPELATPVWQEARSVTQQA